jgi:hypothetical protein
MPKGSTPLDFAYRIHSAVGNKCVGAKVNGKLVPLETELATGDRVEIMTSASSKGPSSDWIRICKTPQAKAKIRQFLKKELRQENLALGRDMIEHECARRGVRLGDLAKPENYEGMLKKYGFAEFDDICCAVGGDGTVNEVARAIVLLSRTPKACCLFHPFNNHSVLFDDVMNELKVIGEPPRLMEEEEFVQQLNEAKNDPQKAPLLTGLLAYEDMSHGQRATFVPTINHYTTAVLLRLGFRWSPTSWNYVDSFLVAISRLGFFN